MRITLALALLTVAVGCRSKDDTEFPTFHDSGLDTGPQLDEDADGDGYTLADDCDDADAAVNPGATEICNGIDDDCDDLIDDDPSDGATWYEDDDGDSYGDPADAQIACDQPDGFVANADDCDDTDADVRPGVTDLCDGVDNDCDGDVDPDDSPDASTWYIDGDGDGYGDADGADEACGEPEGYVSIEDALAFDCDDSDATSYPGGEEVCDGADNDCDGEIDDNASDATTWYIDADGDGFGVDDYTQESCDQPSGYVADDTDCDGLDPDVYPGADEYCDGGDDDCDGDVDEDAADALTWYLDYDSDGYGTAAFTSESCDQPSGYVDNSGDCQGADADSYPGADEYCDEVDNDCDGATDEGVADATTWYADGDGDGYGDDDTTTEACDQPSGYVAVGGDCDDSDASETDSATWYDDDDGDGYGDASQTSDSCEQPDGFVGDDTDCDDSESSVYPGAEEVCDGFDNDCDGDTDEAGDGVTWYADADDDGYGDPDDSQEACAQPSGYVSDDTDCDDTTNLISPADDEECGDGDDNDCDGAVDEDGDDAATWYADADGDGYGDIDSSTTACAQPSGYTDVDDATDCDDADASISPGATEVCDDGIDNDCDGGSGTCGISGEIDLGDAEVRFLAERLGDRLGASVDGAGDVDGDGYIDLLLGAPYEDAGGTTAGAAYLVLGSSLTSGDFHLGSADAKMIGENATDYAGGDVTGVGDLDGDGYDDVLVGAIYADGGGTYSGGAYLINGPITADMDLSAADAILSGEASYNYAGNAVAAAGDVDGDGYDDVIIGAYYAGTGGGWGSGYTGAAYLVHGPITADLNLSAADAKLTGESSYNYAGSAVDGPGDLDGDGYDDLLVGARGVSTTSSYVGAAYLINGPVTADMSLRDADVKMVGEDTYDYAGSAASGAGDVNGDGYDDVIIGAYYADTGSTYSGAAYVVLGPITADLNLADADARLGGENATDYAGWSVDGASDVDGDGRDDLMVGAYQEDSGGSGAGAAYLVLGPVTGEIDLGDADAKLTGEGTNDQAGSAVSLPGDLDGDGYAEIFVGAQNADPPGTNGGAAYLFYGGGL